MNVEPPSATSSSAGSGAPPSQRKERGAIAAQVGPPENPVACETCRSRKQKCDEARPKCGTCQKFKLDCRYREPQPTKKDKTLSEILDRLKLIEGKVDQLGFQQVHPSPYEPSQRSQTRPAPAQAGGGSGDSVPTTASIQPSGQSSPTPQKPQPYKYVSAVHKLMAWPVVRQVLDSGQTEIPNLHAVIQDRDPPLELLEQQRSRRKLATDGMEGLTMDDRALLGLRVDAHRNPTVVRLSDLDWPTVESLSKAYFDTFNFIYPIMDRQAFNTTILTSVVENGFNEGVASTLVCLVFALGAVALADSQNMPFMRYKGQMGRPPDRAADRPPGLAFFNEARKRLGFSMAECSLESVQIHALAGLYYESCSRHLEFWRMTISASMACHALISAYLNLELEIPLTGLDKLEGKVGLPDFSGPFCEADYLGNQESRFQEHFASQIVLRQLSVGFHDTMRDATGPTAAPMPFPPPDRQTQPSEGSNPVITTINHLAYQLDQWRALLPVHLRWSDGQASAFSTPIPDLFTQGGMYPPQQMQAMFTADISSPSAPYPYATDVQVAMLRTRYYYTKYLLYRPAIYKALHHTNMLSTDDAKAVAECLKASLKWPIIMAPTCHRKRLVPCLFFWTQNLLGVLILLHLSQQVPVLSNIRARFCDNTFDMDATDTVNLSIAWIRDLKDVDATAEWCWNVLRGMYRLDD
ncbi:uncharacterized protein VDAG_03199 [Verticillium dahliae VdLs.17]|uniref:Zn(2)-C6 fungal-type domain-containing protein n=1 Tax=Verticillium dahliae (strain VdLs.17 / ATCC MYA-4575 / FGSC 10137) TaxID=498257 RepID=G2WYV7_VERDV|nr:uncharacterized protein VDAG_03199 [Verticillium dahliae VdLs.17]EGY21759.1 hypothetical protein VDAG_03199 [Verticillium dahliae VdLs.17]KAH6703588.1 hypothetical protein EV126DRAFT_440865 [Verticillium dahliae]